MQELKGARNVTSCSAKDVKTGGLRFQQFLEKFAFVLWKQNKEVVNRFSVHSACFVRHWAKFEAQIQDLLNKWDKLTNLCKLLFSRDCEELEDCLSQSLKTLLRESRRSSFVPPPFYTEKPFMSSYRCRLTQKQKFKGVNYASQFWRSWVGMWIFHGWEGQEVGFKGYWNERFGASLPWPVAMLLLSSVLLPTECC